LIRRRNMSLTMAACLAMRMRLGHARYAATTLAERGRCVGQLVSGRRQSQHCRIGLTPYIRDIA
jgi:hypothetical protein